MMSLRILITDYFVQDDVLRGFEDVFLYLRIGLFELLDEHLGLQSGAADSTFWLSDVLGEAAGALDELEPIEVPPRFHVIFPNEVKRPDEFHTFEVVAVQLWEHRLIGAGMKEVHEDGLDHVVIMMAEGDFVAAHVFGEAIQGAPPHLRAKIARRMVLCVGHFEDVRLHDFRGDVHDFEVVFDLL